MSDLKRQRILAGVEEWDRPAARIDEVFPIHLQPHPRAGAFAQGESAVLKKKIEDARYVLNGLMHDAGNLAHGRDLSPVRAMEWKDVYEALKKADREILKALKGLK